MMSQMMTMLTVLFFTSISVGIIPVEATSLFDARSSCTGPNCGSRTIETTYNATTQLGAQGAIHELYTSGSDECLRVDIRDLLDDLDASLVCPGYIFSRRLPSPSTHLLSFRLSAPVKGYCVLIINKLSGVGTLRNVSFSYGRYNLGNPNCS